MKHLLSLLLHATQVSAAELKNPLGSTDPTVLIGNIVGGLLGIVGTVALLLFIYGGLMMMLSTGDPGKVKTGRDTMLWAAIGLGVIFSSYALTRYALTIVTGKPF